MNKLFELVLKLSVSALAFALLGCGTDTAEWSEEVQLFSGKMIVVERKAKAESSGFPNSQRGRDLEFELSYKPMNLHWKGTREQITFEIIDGVAYLVLSLNNMETFCKGRSSSDLPIQVLQWKDGTWVEVDQAAFPISRSNYNLYAYYWGLDSRSDAKGLITWKKKSLRYPDVGSMQEGRDPPHRPFLLREFYEVNRLTCARFQ